MPSNLDRTDDGAAERGLISLQAESHLQPIEFFAPERPVSGTVFVCPDPTGPLPLVGVR